MIGDLYGVMLATSEPGRALVRYTQADRTIVSAVHAHGWRTRRSERDKRAGLYSLSDSHQTPQESCAPAQRHEWRIRCWHATGSPVSRYCSAHPSDGPSVHAWSAMNVTRNTDSAVGRDGGERICVRARVQTDRRCGH